MEVKDVSQEVLTISIHKGLYRYHRLTFGIASAPVVFQRIIQESPGVVVELTGETEEETWTGLTKCCTGCRIMD